ncbi:MAG: hypothetical protein HZC41_04515 [Chloroflexi bacterium]|nr:hypothetical protein [Chloroflexota bacterium]
MNKRLSRIFVVAAFALIFTAMLGIIALGLLTAARNQSAAVAASATFIIARNRTTEALLTTTETAAPTRTATFTPSAAYEPTLYALRRTEAYNIMASMGPTEYAVFSATETALVVAFRAVGTPAPCGFVWARQPLPEVERQARTALDNAGQAAVEIRYVEAYGENCLETDGRVRYFAAMTTDFYLSAEVVDLNDEARLGQMVESIYRALLTLTDLPARLGYLDMIFTSGGQERRLRVMFDQIEAALDTGYTGAALWSALQPQ